MANKRVMIMSATALVVVVVLVVAIALWRPWGGGAVHGEEDSVLVGVLDRGAFASDEEFRDAAVDAAAKEIDVPFELVGTGREGRDYVAGKVWLEFREDCDEGRARQLVADGGGQWVSSTFAWGSRSAEAYFPEARDAESIESACLALMSLDEVEAAYPEVVLTSGSLHYLASDPRVGEQYYLSCAGFEDAWDTERCELRASIAFLDTGVFRLHEDLAGNVLGGYDAFGSVRLNMSDCEDTSGHGTAVAGVACAVADNAVALAGCSYNAVIKAIRVTMFLAPKNERCSANSRAPFR